MVKDMLDNYQSNKFNIIKLYGAKLNIDYMPSCCSMLSDLPKGNTTSDPTVNAIIKKENKLEAIDVMIKKREQEVAEVDALILTLKYDDRQIIIKRHMENKAFEHIQREIWNKDGLQLKYSDWTNVYKRYTELLKIMESTYEGINKV